MSQRQVLAEGDDLEGPGPDEFEEHLRQLETDFAGATTAELKSAQDSGGETFLASLAMALALTESLTELAMGESHRDSRLQKEDEPLLTHSLTQ